MFEIFYPTFFQSLMNKIFDDWSWLFRPESAISKRRISRFQIGSGYTKTRWPNLSKISDSQLCWSEVLTCRFWPRVLPGIDVEEILYLSLSVCAFFRSSSLFLYLSLNLQVLTTGPEIWHGRVDSLCLSISLRINLSLCLSPPNSISLCLSVWPAGSDHWSLDLK